MPTSGVLSDHFEGLVLYALFCDVPLAMPAGHFIALLTGASPLENTMVSGVATPQISTEVAGGTYVRQPVVFTPVGAGTADPRVSNANALTFLQMPACTVTGIAVMDSETGPLSVIASMPLDAALPVNAGGSVVLAANSIVIRAA